MIMRNQEEMISLMMQKTNAAGGDEDMLGDDPEMMEQKMWDELSVMDFLS